MKFAFVFSLGLVFCLFFNPAWADTSDLVDDSSVYGLWVQVDTFPADSEFVELTINDGDVVYTRGLNGLLWLSVERRRDFVSDEQEIMAKIAELENISPANVSVAQDPELSAQYTYPVYRANYQTGANEDAKTCHDLLIFTDLCTFRIHIYASTDYLSGFLDQEFNPAWIEDWFSHISFRD